MDYILQSIGDTLKVVVDLMLQVAGLTEMIPTVSGFDIFWIWIIVLPKAWGFWGIIADIVIIGYVAIKAIKFYYTKINPL